MQAWFSTAKQLNGLDAEVCFLVQDEFYFGPDRLPPNTAREQFIAPLQTPTIPRAVASMLRTSELVGNESALIEYYRQIIELARSHRVPFNSLRHYFWLRFWLWNTAQQVHVSFPWYDSFGEINRVIESLLNVDDGEVHHDVDQGWELEIHVHNGAIYFRERDPDADESSSAIMVPRDDLIPRVRALKQRTAEIIAHLAGALGADVWTDYVRHEPFLLRRPS
jgi:hypothetical protein